MSNHSHFVLWVRPSVAAGWSAEEVARRWLSVFGKRVNGPNEKEIAQATGNAERIELWRGRLGDVSWFMRCLNEWLARKANAEDECTGRKETEKKLDTHFYLDESPCFCHFSPSAFQPLVPKCPLTRVNC